MQKVIFNILKFLYIKLISEKDNILSWLADGDYIHPKIYEVANKIANNHPDRKDVVKEIAIAERALAEHKNKKVFKRVETENILEETMAMLGLAREELS